MRRIGKLCALLLLPCLLAAALAGCGAREETGEEAGEPVETLRLYASFYPIYALAAMITDGAPDLQLYQLVQPQDGCLRAYTLSDWDAALLASADGLLLGGGGLESFAGAVEALAGENQAVVQLESGMDRVEVEAANADPERDVHWQGENPHVYLSAEGANELAERIALNMELLDPRYEELYRENLAEAERRFAELKAEIEAEAAPLAGVKAAVLNEALVYAARDYGLDALYWARESGESMDGDALRALLDALDGAGIRFALIERQAPQSLVEALQAAGIAVAKLDVLSTHRADEGAQALFDALRGNAAAAREAYENISKEGP